jgi:hypothetical protein
MREMSAVAVDAEVSRVNFTQQRPRFERRRYPRMPSRLVQASNLGYNPPLCQELIARGFNVIAAG